MVVIRGALNIAATFSAGMCVSKTKATIATNKNGIDARVCPHVSKLNPASNPEITGAMILTEITATIARNKKILYRFGVTSYKNPLGIHLFFSIYLLQKKRKGYPTRIG